MLQEQQGPIIDTGQPSAKPFRETPFIVFLLDFLLLLLPVHTKWRISKKVVKSLVLEPIISKDVTEAYIVPAPVVIDLLHEHVRCSRGEGAFVVVLPVCVELGCQMMLTYVVLRHCQHAAGTTRWVQHLANGAGCGQQFIVVDEQYIHHQADHFARCEMVSGGLVS